MRKLYRKQEGDAIADFTVIGEVIVGDDGTVAIRGIGDALDDVANKDVGSNFSEWGLAFKTGFVDAIMGGIGAAIEALKGLATAGFDFLKDSIGSASDSQLENMRLNKLVSNQLKQDAIQTLEAATATGHYADVAAGSAKDINKLKDGIERQNKAMEDAAWKASVLGKSVDTNSDSYKLAQAKLNKLNTELGAATATHKQWIDTTTKAPEVLHANIDQLHQWASSLQDVTRFSDETAASAEAVLYKFDRIGKDVFPDALKSAADVAEMMGTDLPNAAQLVGKALEDPVGGIAMLNKSLKLLDPQEVKNIANMEKHGKHAEAQAAILDKLKEKFGGLAEEMGNTLAGKWTILTNKFDDFKEKVGNAILPVLSRMMDKFAPMMDKLLPKLGDLIENKVGPALMSLADGFMHFIDTLGTGQNPVENIINGIIKIGAAIGFIIQGAFNAAGAFTSFAGQTMMAIDNLGSNLQAGFANIGVWLSKGVSDALSGIAGFLGGFFSKGSEIVANIVGGISGTMFDISGKVGDAISVARDKVGAFLGDFLSKGREIINNIVAGINQVKANIESNIKGGIETAKANVAAVVGNFLSVGANIISGIVSGITANAGKVAATLSNIVNAAIAVIKSQLGISSPSKVFAGFGYALPEGMAAGIKKGAHLPTMELAGMTASIVRDGAGYSNVDSRAYQTSNTNIYNFGGGVYQSNESNTQRAAELFRKS